MIARMGEKLTLYRPSILAAYHGLLDWMVGQGIVRSQAIKAIGPLATEIAKLPTPEEVRDSLGALDKCLDVLDRIKVTHPQLVRDLDLTRLRHTTAKLRLHASNSGNNPDQSGQVQNHPGGSGPSGPGVHDGAEPTG